MKRAAIQRARSDQTTRLGRYSILKKENLDGVKFFLDAPTPDKGAEAWVLLRASGTEPLLRVYAEAASPGLVNEILTAAESFVNSQRLASATRTISVPPRRHFSRPHCSSLSTIFRR